MSACASRVSSGSPTLKLKKAVALFAGVALLIFGLVAPVGAQEDVIELRVGDSSFWDGPFVEEAGLPFPGGVVGHGALCDIDPGRCKIYSIDVLEPGARLRVALSHPRGLDQFTLELREPSGAIAAAETVEWDFEALIDNPAVGRWTAIVEFRDVTNSTFRMRAALEAVPEEPKKVEDLVPNLRMTPPHEFASGCDSRETISYGAQRCLRFAGGPENIGDGPLLLHMKEPGATGTMLQRINRSDGTFFNRDAGSYEFHAAHGHFHQIGVGEFELLRVVDAKHGELVEVGSGRKQGFCTGDAVIVQWELFSQDAARSARQAVGECSGLQDADGAVMGLARGWADIYSTTTEGNYVEFGDNPDGEYVVRLKTDIFDSILEVSEDDNASYAHVLIEGDTITVLERGYGSDPWDNKKELANDIRVPLAE